MKPIPSDGPALAALLLSEAIQQYERDPALRLRTGIDLVKLGDVRKVRRQLLKQRKR
ncbi:MAG: hypothetical protein JWP57_697 [Spirosoma sp.]|nr:hypothetical protein [Spirosoma sp.]